MTPIGRMNVIAPSTPPLPAPPHRLQVLDNGLRVLTLPMPATHSAYLGVFARAGSAYETAADNGISHFLEHMLLSTSEKYADRIAFNLAIQSIGGEFSAWTHKEITKFSFRVHPSRVPAAAALLRDCLTNEHWTDADVEAERQLILNELDSDEEEAAFAEHSAGILWADTAYARPIIGDRDTLAAITRGKLLEHRRRCYGAGNLVLVVCGRYAPADLDAVLRIFETLPAGPRLAIPSHNSPAPRFQISTLSEHWNYVDAQLAFAAYPWQHEHSIPARFLSFLLESSPFRLAVKLRWQAGFVYHYSAGIEDYTGGGYLSLGVRVSRRRLEETLRMVLDEIARIREEPPTDEEVALARNQYRDFIEFDLDSVDERGHRLGVEEAMSNGKPAQTAEAELARIEQITADDLQRMARSILQKDRLAFIAMGRFCWGEARRARRMVQDWK